MSKELYSCKIELVNNDINKLIGLFGKNSLYKDFLKKIKTSYELLFFEDYLIYDNGDKVKYLYSDIDKVIETDTEFYFTTSNIVLYLPKRDIDYKFISFIRRTFDDIDNRIGEEVGIKEVGKFHDSKVMKNLLFILFIVTILSFFLALGTWYLVIEAFNIEGLLRNTYKWVMLFWLPVPIVTTILSWIYYKKGHNCFKNVVVGVIVFFAILGFGVSAFRENRMLLQFQKEMSYLNNYKDIMKLPVVPKVGTLYYLENNDCYFQNEKIFSCSNIYVYIDDYEDFENNLFKSKYWRLDEVVSGDLESIVLNEQYKTYHSVYNKTLNEYNVMPKEIGKYTMYGMDYVPELSFLRISEFEYEVK